MPPQNQKVTNLPAPDATTTPKSTSTAAKAQSTTRTLAATNLKSPDRKETFLLRHNDQAHPPPKAEARNEHRL